MNEELENNTVISHYRIVSKIGKGGMGEVYLAEDTKLDRKVALKILPKEFAEDAERMSRFVREAKSASALNHPNIITIHEINEYEHTHFIATEFIDGKTLNEYAIDNPLNYKSTLDIAIQVASALDEAHQAGIVHRDIKPDNVMIRDNGLVKILDFGIAKLSEVSPANVSSEGATAIKPQTATMPGSIIGTANYMSPEQANGKVVDARSDIFSFGVVLYEMLAGRLPFDGETAMEMIGAILKDEPKPIDADVPNEFSAIINKCLLKDRNERYQTIKDVLNDLQDTKQNLELQNLMERTISPEKEELKTQILQATTVDDIHQTDTNQTVASNANTKYFAVGFLTLFVAVGGYFGYRYFSSTNQIESIAVMPFVNESGNEDVEYLSDGMTETLISSLSNLPNLNVKARSSVFRYKGKNTDAKTVGTELNVQAVLNGRIVQRGDQLTLNLELVDAKTENVIWSDKYDRKTSDLVTLQSEIAKDVSTKLKTKLSGAEVDKVTNVYTTNSEAYQLYLKGNYFTTKLTKEGFRKGNEFFEQAILLDPNYALAYNGIAFNQLAAMDWFSEPKIAGPKARRAVEKAGALDDKLAETQLLRGMVAHWVEWDWETAESAFKRAIELDPSNPRPFGYYAWFLANLGRNDEAVAAAEKGQKLDPISAEANWFLGMSLIAAGRTDEAISKLQTAVDLEPTYFYAHNFLGRAYLQAGKEQEALKAFERAYELESENSENLANLAYAQGVTGKKVEAQKIIDDLQEKSKNTYVAPYYLAIAYAGLGDNEQVFKQLERAYADKSDSLVLYVSADPQMKDIRNDPRYTDLLQRLGLPE